jgi:DNA topoisomerase I
MRTDSTHLSGDALSMVRGFIKSEFGDSYLPEKPNFYTSSNKSAQEAHEAIRPTNLKMSPRDIAAVMKDDEARVYALIYNRFVACQMMPAVFDQTSITLTADVKDKTGGTTQLAFRASGRKLVFDGFMRITGITSDDQLLPELAEQQPVYPLTLDPRQHFTSPPARYNEASLIKDLESKGIGRPSTYASIISTIQDRQYVLQQDRRLYATLLGKVVTDKLIQAFPQILDVNFTADMESKLDQVEEETVDWIKLLKDFYGPFHDSIGAALEKLEHAGGMASPYKDEATGIPLVYRISATGFFLASSDPNVKLTKPVDAFGNPTIKQISQWKCPKCAGDMIERKGRFGDYLSCSNYSVKNAEGNPSCTMIVPLNKKTRQPETPKVEPVMTGILDAKDGKPYVLRNSKRGPFLGSSNFPKNRTTIQVKKLTPEQAAEVEQLLPELRRRVQKSYEMASAMTGRPIESYGALPPETIQAIVEAPKPVRAKKSA